MSLLLQDTLVISPSTVEHIEGEIADVNERVDLIEASSDCADVVGTKAELDSYDKSKLTDKAVIKVLQDESQENAQTYYRYSKSSNSFTLIGELGPFYTKAEDDALLSSKVDKVTTASKVYGTDTTGAQTTYNVDSFGKVDDVQVNGTSIVANKVANIDLTTKQDKVTISTTTGTVALTDNTIFNGDELSTLTITNPANPTLDFCCQVNFTSGATPTTITASGIIWRGSNVTQSGFTPVANKRYAILFFYNGAAIIGLVQGA